MACAHSNLYPPEAGNSLPQILRAATLASRSTQPANPSLIALAPISNPFGPHKTLISSSTRKPRKIKDTKPYSNYRTRSGPTSTSSRQHSALRSATPGRLGKGWRVSVSAVKGCGCWHTIHAEKGWGLLVASDPWWGPAGLHNVPQGFIGRDTAFDRGEVQQHRRVYSERERERETDRDLYQKCSSILRKSSELSQLRGWSR